MGTECKIEDKLGKESLRLKMKNTVIYDYIKTIESYFKYIFGDAAVKAHYKAVRNFWAQQGNDMLRECSYLNENSIIFELRGYKGDWIHDMYNKYACNCYVFEPVKEFYEIIKERLHGNKKVHAYNMGIGTSTYFTTIGVSEDGSSTYGKKSVSEKIKIKSLEEFLTENQIEKIDLMQINIEGGEYDLLEWIIENGYSKKIRGLQIQFHHIPEINSENRMHNIQSKLESTHRLEWSFRPYVWEKWILK